MRRRTAAAGAPVGTALLAAALLSAAAGGPEPAAPVVAALPETPAPADTGSLALPPLGTGLQRGAGAPPPSASPAPSSAPSPSAPRATPRAVPPAPRVLAEPVTGADVSWPNCPVGLGIPERRTLGLPLPRADARFVVVGLTNGPAFTPNPCLAAQVAGQRGRAGGSARTR